MKKIIFIFFIISPFYLNAKVIFNGKYVVKEGENIIGEEWFKIEKGDKQDYIYGASVFIPLENLGKKKAEQNWVVRTHIEISPKGKLVKYKRWTKEEKETKYQIAFVYKNVLSLRTEYGGKINVEKISPSADGIFILDADVYYLLNMFKYFFFFSQEMKKIFVLSASTAKKEEAIFKFADKVLTLKMGNLSIEASCGEHDIFNKIIFGDKLIEIK